MPDIFHAWKEVGLEKPVVEEKFGNPDRTILTLPLISNLGTDIGTNITTNITTGGDVEDKLQVIISFCTEPRSRAEIQERLGIKSDR